MKKFMALLLMLLTMLMAGCAQAEAPFEGVWVGYEAGWIKWLMPSDWLEMEVSEEMMEANLFYGAFSPDGSKVLQILWTPLTQEKTIEAIEKELAPTVRRIHGSAKHIGRLPQSASATLRSERELEGLREQMKKAIETQNFEEAASLRDRIRELEAAVNQIKSEKDKKEGA